MMNTIVQMEEKGLSSEQAQIEAFYANIKTVRRHVENGKDQPDF